MIITANRGSGAPSAAPAARYGFIDLLRGLALVVMIETHTVNAYVPANLKQGTFFFWIAFVNGLVAPTFLFASGFSVVLQGSRHWEDWLRFRGQFWRQMRRLGFITLVAYFTHLQHFRLSKYLNSNDPDVWKRTFQVDILQCIVASLLIVHLLIPIVRKRDRLAYAAITLAVAVALATPWIWARDFSPRLPLAMALFLNPHGISMFPLFSWAAFLFAGCGTGCWFLGSVDRGAPSRLMRLLPCIGAGLVCAGLLGNRIPVSLPGYADFYRTSPLYVLIRLGSVLLICAGLYWIEAKSVRIPKPVRIAGQESLLVYGLHLFVIFGVLRGKHLGPILGLKAGWLVSFALSAALVVLMLWLAGKWQLLKRAWPAHVRWSQAAVVVSIALVFLLS